MQLAVSARTLKNYSDYTLKALYASAVIEKSIFLKEEGYNYPKANQTRLDKIEKEMLNRGLRFNEAMHEHSMSRFTKAPVNTDGEFYIIVRTKEYERHAENEGMFLAKGGHVMYSTYEEALANAEKYCQGDSERSYFVAKCVARVEVQKPVTVTMLK